MNTRDLETPQVRALVRVIVEGWQVQAGPERRDHVLAGLGRILSADVVTASRHVARPGLPPALADNVVLGGTDSDRRIFDRAYEARGMAGEPAVARMMETPAPVFALRREDVLADSEWYRAPFVAEDRRDLRLDHTIYAASLATPGAVSCVTFIREWGARPFEEHERNLIAASFEQVARLIAPAESELDALPKRRRQVLDLLVAGRTEKQAAEELGVTVHAVHRHVKKLHEDFDVSTRAELLAKVMRGRARK